MKPLKLIWADYRRVVDMYSTFTLPWPELLALCFLIYIAGIVFGCTIHSFITR